MALKGVFVLRFLRSSCFRVRGRKVVRRCSEKAVTENARPSIFVSFGRLQTDFERLTARTLLLRSHSVTSVLFFFFLLHLEGPVTGLSWFVRHWTVFFFFFHVTRGVRTGGAFVYSKLCVCEDK